MERFFNRNTSRSSNAIYQRKPNLRPDLLSSSTLCFNMSIIFYSLGTDLFIIFDGAGGTVTGIANNAGDS